MLPASPLRASKYQRAEEVIGSTLAIRRPKQWQSQVPNAERKPAKQQCPANANQPKTQPTGPHENRHAARRCQLEVCKTYTACLHTIIHAVRGGVSQSEGQKVRGINAPHSA